MVVCTGLGSLLQPGLAVGYASGSAGRGEAAKSEGENREREFLLVALQRAERELEGD